jgi:membrane protease YdiL (CAAX protease family)
MRLLAEQLPWNPILLMAMLALIACVVVWTMVARRWRRRQSILPYQPRRPVPWGGFDLLLVLLFYLIVQSGVVEVTRTILGPNAIHPVAAYDAEEAEPTHPVATLVAEGDPWVLLLCFFSAVIAAPVVEEFLFRALLQGWLEALEHRWRRKMPTLGRLLPRAAAPIALTSLLFGVMHFRVAGPQMSSRSLVVMLAANAIVSLLTIVLAIGLLRWHVGATAADLGWAPRKLPSDVGLGLVAFAAIAVPIYVAQFALVAAFPKYLAPDPVTLFFLALVLGTLYFRTHRIMPSIVVHAALNATSLALALLGG